MQCTLHCSTLLSVQPCKQRRARQRKRRARRRRWSHIRRQIGMIFQQFNLLSSRNVFDIVMFPLEIAHIPPQQAQQRNPRQQHHQLLAQVRPLQPVDDRACRHQQQPGRPRPRQRLQRVIAQLLGGDQRPRGRPVAAAGVDREEQDLGRAHPRPVSLSRATAV